MLKTALSHPKFCTTTPKLSPTPAIRRSPVLHTFLELQAIIFLLALYKSIMETARGNSMAKTKPIQERIHSLTVTMPYDLMQRLEQACVGRGDRSHIIRQAVTTYLDRQAQ
jgi:hypothetical protein